MDLRVALLIGTTACLLLWRLLRIGSRPKDLPPGPPTLPILGNIHQMPTHDAHKQFLAWAQEYGPIYSLMLGTKTLIVLSKDEVVKELLDRRSAIYSDRQDMYIGQTLCSDGLRLLMMRYGNTWRRLRKTVHGILNINAARTYVPYQVLENKQMLYEILREPEQFLDHIRRYSNSLTTTMTFGWRTPRHDDPQLKQLFDGFNEFAVINQTGTAALIDFFPLLRWLPDFILPTQAKARQLHQAEKKLYLSHWLRAKNAIVNGTARPCFCIDLAELQKKEPWLTDDLAAYTSGTFLEAGSDTTSNTIYGFVQAMVLFPDVQKKAQAELDRVVGSGRLPDMEDEPNLKYVRSVVKESLRWMPTTILGAVPHAVMKDDWYGGYRIPKGAGILNNVYGIHNDPQRYPNPREFNPDRYAADEKSLYDAANAPDASQRDQFTFGAGKPPTSLLP